MNYKHILALLFLPLLFGCSLNNEPFNNGQVVEDCSVRVNNYQPTEEEAIKGMKDNLQSINKYHPDREILGSIILKDTISFNEFLDMYEEYNFSFEIIHDEISARNSIVVIDPDNNSKREHIALTAELLSTESPKFLVSAFQSNASSTDLIRFWDENENMVRGIGVGCTSPHLFPEPSEAIEFGLPPEIGQLKSPPTVLDPQLVEALNNLEPIE